jgi:uncharacterized phage protein (TIGR01671 family)
MREIKFKAYDSDRKEIWFPETIGRGYHTENLMQYTGLKDKNGVEIYEGDVVKIRKVDYSCTCDCKSNILIEEDFRDENGQIAPVKVREYDPNDKCTCENKIYYEYQEVKWYKGFVESNPFTGFVLDTYGIENVEVVGNKFENPELLTK